jgi:hypothetical protein
MGTARASKLTNADMTMTSRKIGINGFKIGFSHARLLLSLMYIPFCSATFKSLLV